jgi:hypothetical protein
MNQGPMATKLDFVIQPIAAATLSAGPWAPAPQIARVMVTWDVTYEKADL